MTENPFQDLHWWADFIRTDTIIQHEMLTRAMCAIMALPFDEYEAFGKLFMDRGRSRHRSGYDGPFDQRYLYPFCVGFEVRVNQSPGRLELHAVDRLLFFDEKAVLVARSDPQVDWVEVYQGVLDDIDQNYPHLPAWHEALRIDQYLESLSEPDDSE